jgi:hypothetical protein
VLNHPALAYNFMFKITMARPPGGLKITIAQRPLRETLLGMITEYGNQYKCFHSRIVAVRNCG